MPIDVKKMVTRFVVNYYILPIDVNAVAGQNVVITTFCNVTTFWVATDLCGRFDLVYDPKRSRGHQRSPWPTLWPQRSRWPLWSVWPSLWPQKVTGSLEVAVTYFMTPKVNLTFDLDLDLGHDPKRSRGHKRSRWPTLWPQRSTWPLTLTLTQGSSTWPDRWPQMSR